MKTIVGVPVTKFISSHRPIFPIFLMLTLFLLASSFFLAAAQESEIRTIYIVVPGVDDDGAGLVNLVSPWAYAGLSNPPPAWILRTDTPSAPTINELRAVLEAGVRVIDVDMDIGKYSLISDEYQQRWRNETALAAGLLQNLTQAIQAINEEGGAVQYQIVVAAHSAGTVAVASSWQDGAIYERAILLSPRFRVDIMANLARAGGMDASNLLVVTADGDLQRTVRQPEPDVLPENRFFPPDRSGYGDRAYAGTSYSHLNITGFETEEANDAHSDMINRADDELAWISGAEDGVLLSTVYQEFIQTDRSQASDTPGKDFPRLPFPGSDGGGGTSVPLPSLFPPFCPPFCPPASAGITQLSPLLNNDPTAAIETGGIDFSSLSLNYFNESQQGDTALLGYVFKARLAQPGETSIHVAAAAQEATGAFFTWLALPSSTFWVNLNPNEPERVIDADLGQTDAGRIMLEADFQMKKTVASLLHPDSPLGQAFWDDIYGYIEQKGLNSLCFSFRQWIVPGEVVVWQDADSIYIVKAGLEVKLEAEYLDLKGLSDAGAATCPPETDPSLQNYAEQRFVEMILPELTRQVNTAPEYQSLRSIFQARILAEWYQKQHLAGENTAFAPFIRQGSTCDCYPTIDWSPQELFDQYVQSISQGEFNLTRQTQTQEGNTLYTSTRSYFYGGVDLTTIPVTTITYEEFLQQDPEAETAISQALLSPTGYANTAISWLGGFSLLLPQAEAIPEPEADLDPVAVDEFDLADSEEIGDDESAAKVADEEADLITSEEPVSEEPAPASQSKRLCGAAIYPLLAAGWIGWRRLPRRHGG